jgi:nitrite reductase/ring-hydroxylating ferredoxin subunit
MSMNDNGRDRRCADCRRNTMDRRELLVMVGATAGAAAAVIALPACGPVTGSPPTGTVSVGNLSALPVGGMLVMSNVVVARDAGGVYAMSAVCTHAGCLLDESSQTIAAGLSCPCHGSAFDGNGNVTRGPARAPLQHYAVTVAADGSLSVDGSQPVSASTRTAVA